MPLYTDANYYYSGGSSQLYSPYYPGSSTALPSSTSIYSPYSSSYNRAIGGTYVVPISTARSPSFTTTHGLSSSRYQPKLSTITETSPLISSARHKTLMPLTRIQSPKYTSYATPTPHHTTKYIPPRPILINTADIDVSANRYRKRKEETLRQAQRETEYTSPSSSLKRRNSTEKQEKETEKPLNEIPVAAVSNDKSLDPSSQQHINRSTIKRNRAVVRLSTIRSRSKDRNKIKAEDSSSPEPEKKFKDLYSYQMPEEEAPLKWREKLADDLAFIPSYPSRKTPGDVLREKYLIQDSQDNEDYAAQCRAQRMAAGLPKETIEQVIVELDPLYHTVKRLSIPQCPTFHDICEDISSDKIDDDLNAGELRRRASIIQCQEQELLNELQKSASGTFQMITMERRGSHDSVDETPHKRHSKRTSKKARKIKTKITAIVGIENAPPLGVIKQEQEEEPEGNKANQPKFTANVESVEEHHQIHKVLKLPKKKSIKRAAKIKEQELPEGFMTSIPKPQPSPKKKYVRATPEVFTFDDKLIEQTREEETKHKAINEEEQMKEKIKDNDKKDPVHSAKNIPLAITEGEQIKEKIKDSDKKDTTLFAKNIPLAINEGEQMKEKIKDSDKKDPELFAKNISQAAAKPLASSKLVKTELPKPLATKDLKEKSVKPKAVETSEIKEKPQNAEISTTPEKGQLTEFEKSKDKSSSINFELKTPTTPGTPIGKERINKPSEKSIATNIEQKTPTSPKDIQSKLPTSLKNPLTEKATKITLNPLEKSNALSIELKSPPLHHQKQKMLPKSTEALKGLTNQENEKPSSEAANSLPLDNQTLKLKTTNALETKPKLEENNTLKTSKSLDSLAKPKPSKLSEKSNSINIELKTPSTPKTPIPETIKEDPGEEKVATPKPIKKTILKSDSGEDFWAQIGTRETLYMNKRKQDILEFQWKKREELLESTQEEDVKNLNEIKTKVTTQKKEAMKKTDEEQKNFKADVTRSNSNESALKKQQTTVSKNDQINAKITQDNKDTATTQIKDYKKIVEAKDVKTTDKLEITNSPVIAKINNETSLLTTTTSSLASTTPATKTLSTTTENIITTAPKPKIIGQQAKSPEQQEPAEQNNIIPTTTSPTAKSNKNKNEIDKNKTTTNEKQLLGKTLTLPSEKTKITASATAAKSVAELTTTKQPEIKPAIINKQTTTTYTVTKTKTTDTDANKSEAAAKTQMTESTSPNTHEEAKTTTNVIINADQFINKAPAKTNASPNKVTTKAATTPTITTTSPNNINQKQTEADKKTTTTTSTKQTQNAAAIATTATIKTTTIQFDDSQQICNKNKNTNNIESSVSGNVETTTNNNNSSTGGGNLSKFATVSNLAQCLHDVDADLADYLPSSAEISENEDYKTDDSDFDYSSIDGWEKLTPSMKKKVKQRRRKEKQAEQARFDPQKKVKIDTTRKLYVKDEAPRFPLVATPRPLWKREKIVYPVDDSEDESDSEESGSTEETEDSDECTTSEEYEDELRPTASGGIKSDSGTSADGGSSDANKENPNIIRMSTCSNDSGFEGGTAPASPKKMLETSYTYSQFQKSGRFTPPATIIPRFKNYTVDDFHFLAVLGKGSFGKVLLAELRDTTYYYAVKCLKKDVVLEDDDVDSTLIERKVLALGTKHPYLCHLFCTFQTESHLFFVMEYLNGGDLMFHIQESGRFTEERARFYGAEIVSGLKFLHKKGIIYRDLKLDNVLLDYEGHVRIADFGMCKLQIYLDKTADSFCGTPDYMAPEIIKGDKYNQNVDWWSFGVLLYEMLIGQSPFSGCDEDELFWSICNELPWFPVYISAEATSILKGLLEKDFTKRIGSHYSPAGDIVEHIFFRPIDWNLLEKRQIEPPFRPQVKHPLDTQYFDRVFTRERVRLTPIDKDILQSMDQKQFLGFTYTNPHITLD